MCVWGGGGYGEKNITGVVENIKGVRETIIYGGRLRKKNVWKASEIFSSLPPIKDFMGPLSALGGLGG